MKIELLDSTLRDGAQAQNISFSVHDKLKLMQCMDSFGIDYIEAGNPASNPKDEEFFREAAKIQLKNSKLVAFGSTRRKNTAVEDDTALQTLLDSGAEYISVFGKSWDFHVENILETTLEENLSMIFDTISFLTAHGKKVFFDAEHFFDGLNANREYALEAIKTAEKAGAVLITLCDTNGGAFPEQIAKGVEAAIDAVSCKVGIHCHNDCGLAVANTMSAVKAGAVHIQGTFIGVGERCGNANLSTLIGNLQVKGDYELVPENSIKLLTDTAYYFAEVSNIKLLNFLPYVGGAAFAHKGGMHADGVMKDRRSFEHINPDDIGNRRSFVLSELSGRTSLLSKLKTFDESLEKNSEVTNNIIEKIKDLEHGGYLFEAANASFELLVLKELGKFKPYFEIDDFNIVVSQEVGKKENLANAMIKVKVGERFEITADEGRGPVNAIDNALRKALEVFYPVLSRMHLVDYKVRVIDTKDSTAAVTRVLIESTDGKRSWTTVGVSEDIINASMTALIDSLEYMLHMCSVYNYMK